MLAMAGLMRKTGSGVKGDGGADRGLICYQVRSFPLHVAKFDLPPLDLIILTNSVRRSPVIQHLKISSLS